MFNYFLIIFFTLTAFEIYSCELSIPSKILILQDEISTNDIEEAFLIKKCPITMSKFILEQVQYAKGKTLASRIIPEGQFINENSEIEIIQAQDLIKEKLESGWFANGCEKNCSKKVLSLNEDSTISVFLTNNTKAISIKVEDHNTKKANYITWATSQEPKIKVLRLIRDIAAFNKMINQNDIEVVEIKKSELKDHFTNIESLKFYQNLQSLKKGDFLKQKDLTALNIIKTGSLVKVILDSNGLEIKSAARAMTSGKISDSIQLESLDRKKQFKATVIDFETVKVQL